MVWRQPTWGLGTAVRLSSACAAALRLDETKLLTSLPSSSLLPPGVRLSAAFGALSSIIRPPKSKQKWFKKGKKKKVGAQAAAAAAAAAGSSAAGGGLAAGDAKPVAGQQQQQQAAGAAMRPQSSLGAPLVEDVESHSTASGGARAALAL